MTTRRPEISGVVVDARGRPVADARVSLVDGPVPVPDIAALSDRRGHFTLAPPTAGTYALEVTADLEVPPEGTGRGGQAATVSTRARVEVTGGRTTEIEVRLGPGR